eukprot:TRINITY_DN40145_c0_g1_i1.p1 TRINITY_DN40145_c0_g1~~TRINITY_DN40145_c0_g1_i1.p1  ORF type:complete len:768 (+),score=254.08 TRINITY_DN40145_c0_g1_i1:106-2409(+)
MNSSAVFALLFVSVVAASSGGPTPTQKVVELLGQLSKKVLEEGKVEEKQFADYAKFCEKTIDEKKYYIGGANQKIETLTAQMEAFKQDAASLETEIGELNETAAKLENQEKKMDSARKEELKTYMTQAKEMHNSMSALTRAIQVLEASASQLEGDVASFAKVKMDASRVLDSATKISSLQMSTKDIEVLADLSEGLPKASNYKYKSGDIVGMLKGMLTTFKENKQELDMLEVKNKGAYQNAKMGLTKQLKFTNRDISEKTLARADKLEKEGAASTDNTETTQARDAEVGFVQALEEDCKMKADIAKQRTETRQGELKALKQASDKLAEMGVALLQQHAKASVTVEKETATTIEDEQTDDSQDDDAAAPSQAEKDAQAELEADSSESEGVYSFLQLRGSMRLGAKAKAKAKARAHSKKSHKSHKSKSQTKRMSAEIQQRLVSLLFEHATQLKSSMLSRAAQRIKGADNFVEVRLVIGDLIKRMEASAKAEANTKADCDSMISKHTKNRDDFMGFIENKKTFIDQTDAEVRRLTKEIQQLNTESSETQKELEEATKLRAEEKATNTKTLEDSKAGEEGTTFALDVLGKFYESNAFVQESSSEPKKDLYSGAVLDSSGKSLADMAPKVASEEYKGDQEGSGGLLGMLDVLHSDFVRTVARTEAAETKAEEEFTKLKEESEKELESNSKELEDKTIAITEGSEKLVKAREELKEKEEELVVTQDELDKLKGMCTQGEESYESKRLHRQQEIETLEESIKLLNQLLEEQESA